MKALEARKLVCEQNDKMVETKKYQKMDKIY